MYRYLHTLFLFFLSATLNADPGKDWPAYGGAPGGGHYSTATQINKKNVSDLELAWTHRSGDFIAGTQNIENEITEKSMRSRPTSFMNTPIMVQDTLYYCTPFNRVFALDPGTGEERWSFDPKVDMGKELLSNCRAVSSWLDPEQTGAACQHRILLGTLDARIIALDGATGKPCEDFGNKGQVDLAEGLTEHIGFKMLPP